MQRLHLYLLAILCLIGVTAHAQMMTVTGSQVQDSTGALLSNGTISFAPVDLNGKAISYRMGPTGQVISRAVSAPVSNGVFTIKLPDTSLTNPVNVCFNTTVKDNISGKQVLGAGYTCLQPSSAASAIGWCTSLICNFDLYTPNNPALPVTTVGGTGTYSQTLTSKQVSSAGTISNNTTGNAATATNFDHTPGTCTAGYAPVGITPHGDATGCFQVIASGSGNGVSAGVQYDLQLAGSTTGMFAAQSGLLRSDAEAKGNLYTGSLENDVFDPSWNHHLSGHYISYRDDQDAYTVYNGGAYSSGIPQVRGSWHNYEFSGIGHIWTYSHNIGASTQIGQEVDYDSREAGQNLAQTGTLSFLGDGDNISSERQMQSGGNTEQANMEGTHGDWLDIYSQGNATGNCLAGCGQNGSFAIYTGYPSGQGNVLVDRTDNIHGAIVGFVGNSGNSQPFTEVQVSGFSLGASKRFQINEAVTVDQHVPATTGPCCGSFVNTAWATTSVDVSINTTPVYAGALTDTTTVPSSGYGCLVNPPTWTGLSSEIVNQEMYERVAYTVKDATHFTIYPVKVHSANSEFFIGGACGYGIEQQAQSDYQGGITVYPLAGSLDDSHLIYVGDSGMILGASGTHGFENASCSVTSIARSGSTNTITLTGCSGVVGSLNQQKVNITGITADSSFNASNVTLTATAPGAWTYPASVSGTIATTPVSAGTLTAGDTGAYIYPIAEVLLAHNPTKETDNNVVGTSPFYFPTSNAVVTRSLPYYSQFNGNLLQVRPTEDTVLGGYGHHVILKGGAARGPTGSGQYGYVAENDEPCSSYQNCGGTYLPPNAAFYSQGKYQTGLYMFTPPMDGSNAAVFVNDTGAWYPAGTTSPSYNLLGTATGMGINITRGLEGANPPEAQFMTLFAPNTTIGQNGYGFTVYATSLAGPHGVLGESANRTYETITPVGDHSGVASLTVNQDGGGHNLAIQANGGVSASSYTGPATAPSGSCPTSGVWVFSQDGHATFCASGTWVTKI